MKKIKGTYKIGLTLLFLVGGAAHGQIIPVHTFVDAKTRASDPRLDTLVTFDADRMYLGEVLENISAQTGVSVSIPATDSNSGTPITCHIKNVPLADLMNSLWSLVGYSKATWQITSDTQYKPRSYRLLPTPSSRALADRLNMETEHATAKLWNLFLKISAMTPIERQANIHRLADAMLLDNNNIAKSYMQDTPSMNQFWARFGIVATELSAEQQDQLQRGAAIYVPINSLTPEHQELMSTYLGHSYTTVNEVRTELPPPDKMKFYFSRYAADQKRMMRDLYIGVGSEDDFSGTGSMGAMEIGLKLRLYQGWILPGDEKSTNLETQTVSALPNFPEDSLWKHVPAFDLLLTQLADAQNVSYMGIIPEDARDSTTISLGKSVKQCFEDLQIRAGLMHKWRTEILLFNYPVWFYGDDALYPYAVVKHLRESSRRRKDGRPLTLIEIADFVSTLTDPQMKRLAKEFPQVEDNKSKRPLFVFYKKYPGILSENGMTVSLNMLAMLKQLRIIKTPSNGEELERLRIIEDLTNSKEARRLYRVQFQARRPKTWIDAGRIYIFPGRSGT